MPLSIRPARPDDATAILALIRAQAAFEQAPNAVAITEEVIRRDGFGRCFEVQLAELDGRVCGLVVLYQTYSSWQGAPTLVVHDLFVEEAARRSGAGQALLATVAALAKQRGCCRMDVNVLAWNEGARRFYECLGFAPLTDWLPYRLDGAGIERLAGKA